MTLYQLLILFIRFITNHFQFYFDFDVIIINLLLHLQVIFHTFFVKKIII